MTTLSSQDLANLSVDELLNLGWDSISKVESFVYPTGVYSATLVAAEIPNPSEEINYFNFQFALNAVVELEDETKLASISDTISAGNSKFSTRYYTTGGFGIQKMRTDFSDIMTAVSGEGASLGEFFATLQQGDPLNVVLLLKEVTTKPNKKKGETYETYTPRQVNELGGVQLAE